MTGAPASGLIVEATGLDKVPNEADAQSAATIWHSSQRRKYTGEPYIAHPRAVRDLILTVPHDVGMLCACWLHDVVEDCGVSREVIRQMFGEDVHALVDQLSDVSKPEDGNRAKRKAIDREHYARASARAQTIKLADMIDNSRSIVQHDAAFAQVYLAEKRLLLDVLRKGDATLWAVANDIVETYLMMSCPFCGCDNLETSPWPGDRKRTYYVCCCGNPECKAEVCGKTMEEAARKWNRTALARSPAQ